MSAKTVIITGSTSGIGLGLAEAYAKAGYNIVFNGLEPDGPRIAATIATRQQVDYLFSDANMLDPASLRKLVEDTISRFGRIDVLVNNAGVQHVSAVDDFPEDKWNDIININLNAVFHLSKAVWKHMRVRKFGRIINIASVHGLVASEFKSAYVSAKHGVVGLTKVLALEGAPLNITCNAICPGYVETPLVVKQVADQARVHNMPEEKVVSDVLLKKQAVKTFVPISVIADMCLLLSSESAATITGTAIPIDGGWGAQ